MIVISKVVEQSFMLALSAALVLSVPYRCVTFLVGTAAAAAVPA